MYKALLEGGMARKYRRYSAKTAFFLSIFAEYRAFFENIRILGLQIIRNFWLKIMGILGMKKRNHLVLSIRIRNADALSNSIYNALI